PAAHGYIGPARLSFGHESQVLGTDTDDDRVCVDFSQGLRLRHGNAYSGRIRQERHTVGRTLNPTVDKAHGWRSDKGRDELVDRSIVEFARRAKLMNAAVVHH